MKENRVYEGEQGLWSGLGVYSVEQAYHKNGITQPVLGFINFLRGSFDEDNIIITIESILHDICNVRGAKAGLSW